MAGFWTRPPGVRPFFATANRLRWMRIGPPPTKGGGTSNSLASESHAQRKRRKRQKRQADLECNPSHIVFRLSFWLAVRDPKLFPNAVEGGGLMDADRAELELTTVARRRQAAPVPGTAGRARGACAWWGTLTQELGRSRSKSLTTRCETVVSLEGSGIGVGG